MDVYTVVRASLRRWYVLIPLLVLVGLATAYEAKTSQPTYTQSAQLLITGRSSQTVKDSATIVNPLGGSDTTLAVLVPRLNGSEFISATANRDASVSAAVQAKAPVLVLTSVGTSAAGTEQALQAAVQKAPEELNSLQRDLNVNSAVAYSLQTNVEDPSPSVDYPSRNRTAVITALVGLVAAVIVTDVVDALLRRRRRPDTVGSPVVVEDAAPAADHRAVTTPVTTSEAAPRASGRRRARRSTSAP